MLTHAFEQVRWIDVDDQTPDDEMTVMVFAPDDATESWPGYLLDGQWIWQNGTRIAGKVVAWAEMLAGPGQNDSDVDSD